ncbi:putative Ig domain-containing protein [Actinocrispum wychmicini]|uniref:Cellulose binding domain-containing protein n=1 Tax=Actinocrispum wychmicini TaxID=1213861 RepID=A0A4R2J731_9PSEU|nr:putative Ig domain-containing protein [Actinocrispum wychmicini]TCO52298.1 cellulose binding domain-containing protein [Actinocrispum wychmicini]
MRVALGLVALGLGLGVSLAPAAAASGPQLVPASCATAPAGKAKCQAMQLVLPAGARPAAAMSPTDLQKAYGVTGRKSGGTTVAIVDAFNDPHIERDLGDFRSHWSLPACTKANGCLTVVGQDGTSTLPTGTDSGWATEMAIDVDAVSAVCPDCKILLVEGNTNDDNDLAAAVDSAVRLGAKIVSNSYTDHENAIPSGADTHYNHPGVAVLAATGDNGSESGAQAEFPASSPEVVAVGGTTLTASSGGRGFTETVWNGTGSGCSSLFAKPAYQNVTTTCAKRATSDISADADPNTGITIFVNGATSQFGGTSLATPIVAGIWALAGTPNSGDNPASYPYAHPGNFFDVTSGSNGSCGTVICNAGQGWDGPTGLGTPNGTAGLTPGGNSGTVTVTNPGDQTSTVGQPVNLQITATGGTTPYSFAAQGLPAGLSIDSKTGKITGSPTTAGTSQVTVTVTDATGATSQAQFRWTVTAPGSTLNATFTTDFLFSTGAFAHFTITNTGSSGVSGWQLAFDIPASESLALTNPGTANGRTGHVVITGQNAIPAGGSLTVNQFYQVASGTFTAPANVVVTAR